MTIRFIHPPLPVPSTLHLGIENLLHSRNWHRLDTQPSQCCLRDILRAARRSQLLAGDDIALPVRGIERLHNPGRARSLAGEIGNQEHPVVGNGAIALQHLRLRRYIPTVVGIAPFFHTLVRRRLYLERCAVLHDEIEGRIDLARRRETVEYIADKILSEHAYVGVLVCQIPERPAVEGQDLKETGYWR